MPTVNYLQVVGWGHVAAKRAEKNEGYMKSHRSSNKNLWRPIYIANNELKKPPKVTNITSTDITFGGAWAVKW